MGFLKLEIEPDTNLEAAIRNLARHMAKMYARERNCSLEEAQEKILTMWGKQSEQAG